MSRSPMYGTLDEANNLSSNASKAKKSSMISHIESVLPKTASQTLQLLEAEVKRQSFTAWSIANPQVRISAAYADEWQTVPTHTDPFNTDEQESHPFFDLGSLTKPFLGGALFLLGQKNPKECIDALLQEKLFAHHPTLNFASLFSHQSGLPAWVYFARALYNDQSKLLTGVNHDFVESALMNDDRLETFRSRLIRGIFAWKAMQPQGTVAYSDCGYYALARLMEEGIVAALGGWRAALQNLNAKLGTGYFHASLNPDRCTRAVPYFPYIVTARDEARAVSTWKKFGPALDTNANLLAMLSPLHPQLSLHAGLFGRVDDLERSIKFFQQHVSHLRAHLGQNNQATSQKQRDSISQLRNSRFFFCFDTPTSPQTLSAAEACDFENTFGHLGYTGTSAWFKSQEAMLDDQRVQPYWILLTNRSATSRKELRVETAPRLFRFDIGAQTIYGVAQHSGNAPMQLKEIEEITPGDWSEIRERYTEASQILWDQSCCKIFSNINEVRRKVGTFLFRQCQ